MVRDENVASRVLIDPERSRMTEEPSDPRAADLRLVRRCLGGDALAWRALYDAHFRQVERLLFALGIADSDADDLCQEIFLLVHRHLDGFRGDSRLGTWIHRLATREAIRFARRGRLRRKLGALLRREGPPPLPPDWAESAAGRRHFLRQLLDRLPPERRLALVLFEIEGLPVGQIAQLLGCSENTVWTRIHRARTALEGWSKEGAA
jgi:RNA polymerase sigma-70 factor (ECF subfamily)